MLSASTSPADAPLLTTDALRCCAQAALAVAVFTGRPQIWVFIVTVVARGSGDAFFRPALRGLTVQLTSGDRLADANALLGAADAAGRVAGPALAASASRWPARPQLSRSTPVRTRSA